MPLLRNGCVVEDIWQPVDDDAPLPDQGPIVVSLSRLQADREKLRLRHAPLGVRLKNTDDVALLSGDLAWLDLVVLDFPKFTDGRAYTQARLLRERMGYAGEIRATGQVLLDQLLFMQRCGFDAFVVERPDAEDAWRQALAAFSVFYQPTSDGRAPVNRLRRRLQGSPRRERVPNTKSGVAIP